MGKSFRDNRSKWKINQDFQKKNQKKNNHQHGKRPKSESDNNNNWNDSYIEPEN